MESIVPDWFFNCARRALLGEIYESIRGIAFEFDEINGRLKLRYYLDRVVEEDDVESIDSVANEIEAMLPIGYLTSIDTDCIHTDLRSRDLEAMDGWLYFRREH